MDYRIREIRENGYYVLSEFLYEAIFIPKGMEKPPKSMIESPELQVVKENEEEYTMVCSLNMAEGDNEKR